MRQCYNVTFSLLLAAAGLAGVTAQADSDYANYPADDFQCPDELEGYFPHAYRWRHVTSDPL